MKPTAFLCLRDKVKNAWSYISIQIRIVTFHFSRSFNDILNSSGSAESKSKLIAKQRVCKNIKRVAVNLRHWCCIKVDGLKKTLKILSRYNVSHPGILNCDFHNEKH